MVEATPYISGEPAQVVFASATAENCDLAYYPEMAEKRGYDRAVLITVLKEVGGHGSDFYGESEADGFAKPDTMSKQPTEAATEQSTDDAYPGTLGKKECLEELENASSMAAVTNICKKHKARAIAEGWAKDLGGLHDIRKAEFEEAKK